MLPGMKAFASEDLATRLRPLVRYGYFPLMFLGVNGIAVASILAAPSPAVIAATLGALLAMALTLSFGAERMLPYEPQWNRSRGDLGRDVVHFVVNESMSLGPLLILPLFAVAVPASPATSWPGHWPVAAQILFALVSFDLAQYLVHWVSHRWYPLWRLHAVHHAVERLYGFNGIMKHPMYQLLSSIVSMTPLVVLGMPDAFSLVLAFCTMVQLLLQHSNVDYRTGPIRWVCATAEVHRFHHLRGKAGDVNFALFFSLWDHSFGSAFEAEWRVGVSDVGLDEVDYPQDYLGQLLMPFRARRAQHPLPPPLKAAPE